MERASMTSKRHLLDAIWLSDVGCELGFSIGIKSAVIGFFVGRKILHLLATLRRSASSSTAACSAVVFALSLIGGLLGLLALFGLSVLAAAGRVAHLLVDAAPVTAWIAGGAVLLALSGALVLLPPERPFFVAVRFLDEVLWFADVVTWSSLRFSWKTTHVMLRSSSEALGVFGHVDAGATLEVARGAAVDVLLSKPMVRQLTELADMFGHYFGRGFTDIRLPELRRALSALGRLQELSQRSPAAETRPIDEVAGYADVQRFVWFALGMHGHAGLKFLGAIPYGSAGTDLDALAMCASIPSSDVILCEWRGQLHLPGYAVALDAKTETVVLVVRGSLWPEDFVTDLDCRPRACSLAGHAAFAHSGMLSAAEALSQRLATTVEKLLARGPYARWRLVLTGHSLGAGSVALLAALWLGPGSPLSAGVAARLSCVGYGMPAVASAAVGRELRERVTAVVFGADMVPRFSLSSAERLRDAVLALWREPGAVDALLEGASPPSAAEAGRRLDALMGESGEGELRPLGRVLWAPPPGSGGGIAEVEDPESVFRDLPLVGHIFEPHLPQNYAARFGAGQGPVPAFL